MWSSKRFHLPPYKRGFHLITDNVVSACPGIRRIDCGLLTVSLLHTSASLCINENADPSVRQDLEAFCTDWVSEETPYFIHTYEGKDDMPAHIKSALFGTTITLPIENGRLVLGEWQGIYLGEHRNNGGSRQLHSIIAGNSA